MGEQLDLFPKLEEEIKKITKKRKKRKDSPMPDSKYNLLEFKRIINQLPPKSFLKWNTNYENHYIPLQILEMMLRSIYISYEPIIKKDPIVVEGNIIFFVDVVVKNPITNAKETYTGASAIPIMPKAGTVTDIHPHIPAGVSFAIMNACKHIGRLFRAENDDCTKVFDTYFQDKQKEIKTPDDNMKDRLLKVIKASKTIKSLERKGANVKALGDSDVYEAYYEQHFLLQTK